MCWSRKKPQQFVSRIVPPGTLKDPTFRQGFAQLAPLGLSFESWQYHPQLPDAIELARAFPETTIILNHVGGVLGVGPYYGRRQEILASWRKDIAELAKCPNVNVKLGGIGMASFGQAQTLTVMNAIEVAHLDPMRTSAPSFIAYLVSDTLVSLDYDLKTIHPLLAKSWTISEDGKLYTFKLRDDVTFCSGKKFTADAVVYSVKRMVSKETKSPFYWRMGKVKDVRATDPLTVEYELEEHNSWYPDFYDIENVRRGSWSSKSLRILEEHIRKGDIRALRI